MKKILFIAVALIATLSIHAQSEVGTISVVPKMGMTYGNYVSICHTNETHSDILESCGHPGFTIGAEIAYQYNSYFQPSISVMYANLGNKFERRNDGTKYAEHNAHHIVVPIMANFYVWKGLALKTGIQPSLMIDCNESHNGWITYRRNWNMLDIIIPMGLSYEYKNFVADLRYNVGTIPVGRPQGPGIFEGKIKETTKKFHHQYLSFTFGYKFDLNKKYDRK